MLFYGQGRQENLFKRGKVYTILTTIKRELGLCTPVKLNQYVAICELTHWPTACDVGTVKKNFLTARNSF